MYHKGRLRFCGTRTACRQRNNWILKDQAWEAIAPGCDMTTRYPFRGGVTHITQARPTRQLSFGYEDLPGWKCHALPVEVVPPIASGWSGPRTVAARGCERRAFFRASLARAILKTANEVAVRLVDLLDIGVQPAEVPVNILQPVLEGASLQDDPNLQSAWANLLANAADGRQMTRVEPSFVAMLRNLSSRGTGAGQFPYFTEPPGPPC
jgi:hypothetical protein